MNALIGKDSIINDELRNTPIVTAAEVRFSGSTSCFVDRRVEVVLRYRYLLRRLITVKLQTCACANVSSCVGLALCDSWSSGTDVIGSVY